MLDFLQNAVPTHGLKLLFLAGLAWFIFQTFRNRSAAPAKLPPGGWRMRFIFLAVLLPLLTATLVYQATWQLTGFARPEFVRFMKAYNRRDVNAARELTRGRMFDRGGVEIARDRADRQRTRYYPQGLALCHLAGYADPVYGLYGLERSEDAWLAGRSLDPSRDLNRFARNLLDRTQIVGGDLQITADHRLQALATRLLAGKRGAVVAIRPSDGAILALASAPAFDPNRLTPELFADAGGRDAPLLNRALHGLYPPGSTFKLAMAALAAERGFDRLIDCPAEGFAAAPGAKPIRDHAFYENQRHGRTWAGYGRIGLREAFAKSSNVFFARLGVELGPAAMNEAAPGWLFGRAIPLQGLAREGLASRPGSIPALREGERLRVAQLSIGQGEMLVTPLQMALLTAGIANDGLVMTPRIVDAAPVEPLGRISSPAAARQVRSIMREAVVNGTGRRAQFPDLEIAGKTGTAQVAGGEDHSWFVCFAPYARPGLAVAVLVENGGYGSTAALPIATLLLREAQRLGLLNPPPAVAGEGGR